MRKQERRGGIETRIGVIEAAHQKLRSRNAVVALKPLPHSDGKADLVGSRNAVVALKLGSLAPRRRKGWTKQERRGGIETRGRDGRRGPGRRKQERRGGIETSGGHHHRLPLLQKQERRGGIETVSRIYNEFFLASRSRNAVVALKRIYLAPPLLRYGREAGTPWWH